MGQESVAALRGVDRRLEALYRQLGWRNLILGYVAFGWAAVSLMGLLLLLGAARVEHASLATGARAFANVLLTTSIGLIGALAVTNRIIRPLRVLENGGKLSVEAWRSIARIPVAVAMCSCLFGALCGPIGGAFAFAEIQGDSRSVWVPLVLMPLCGVIAVPTGIFGLQLMMRPIMRRLGELAPQPPHRRTHVSLRHKILLAGPAISLALVALAVATSATPGTSITTATTAGLAAAALAALISVPAVLQLGWSMLAPLSDLMDATYRINRGDYSTPIAVLSNDEYGDLGASLNLAMGGLADRERLARENERLLEDVRASRARLVAASDAERRRVERNLHDGAQQRLVALAYELRLIEMRASDLGLAEISAAIKGASSNLSQAIDEVRELARGLHPAILTTDGLPGALRQLAALSTLPVSVNAPQERLAPVLETTAYYVVAETLANAEKHSASSAVSVDIRREGEHVILTVEDDGSGGAIPYPGSGLSGLADRVAAIGGDLTIQSPVGGGTRITASLPMRGEVLNTGTLPDPR